MKWETTTILLERLKASDEDAWARFAGRFRRPLVAFGVRCGLPESAAEDAAQDALMKFVSEYRNGKYDREKGRLNAWLFALAFQAIRSARRDAGRAPNQSPAGQPGRTTFFSALPDEQEAQVVFEMDWDRHVLTECLGRLRSELDPKHFQAFELVTFKQVPAAEAAAQVGMSRDAVYQLKLRALRRLERLSEELCRVDGAAP